MSLQIMMYILAKKTIWEKFLEELQDVIKMFGDFFTMIKEITYDVLVGKFGTDATNILLIMVLALGIMLVCISVINK